MLAEKELLKKWNNNTHPVVSICTITYNHQDYIAEAIESFLEQKTNFPFEILIHDDASTDRTPKIIKEYEKKYPSIIKTIYQTVNQKSIYKSGMNPRFNYPRAHGKYIALCDGDDYWTDPYKLQKQVDFLEANPDYSLVQNSRLVIDSSSVIIKEQRYKNETWTIEDIVYGKIPFTQTMLFKNLKGLADFSIANTFLGGDRMVAYYLSLHGNIKCLSDIVATYRIGINGVWSRHSKEDALFKGMDSLVRFHQILGLPKQNSYFEIQLKSTLLSILIDKERTIINSIILFLKFGKKYGVSVFTNIEVVVLYFKHSMKRIVKSILGKSSIQNNLDKNAE